MCTNQTKYQLEMMASFFDQNPMAQICYTTRDDGVYMKISDQEIYLGFGGTEASKGIREFLRKQK